MTVLSFVVTGFVFILKCIVISAFIDFYLYWFHRFYHWEGIKNEDGDVVFRNPLWKAHQYHHKHFSDKNIFAVHPTEIAISCIPGFLFSWWLTGPIFGMFVVFWGLFEASRGHGHYQWFKLPKSYYRKLQFTGIRYHAFHHEIDQKKNYGQFLKVGDRLFGTMAVKPIS